jgi:hypothetical protein
MQAVAGAPVSCPGTCLAHMQLCIQAMNRTNSTNSVYPIASPPNGLKTKTTKPSRPRPKCSSSFVQRFSRLAFEAPPIQRQIDDAELVSSEARRRARELVVAAGRRRYDANEQENLETGGRSSRGFWCEFRETAESSRQTLG